jgi:hypothetical protein
MGFNIHGALQKLFDTHVAYGSFTSFWTRLGICALPPIASELLHYG